MMMITKKECAKCGQIKSLSEFGVDEQNDDGLRAVCKECHNKLRRDRHMQNKRGTGKDMTVTGG